MKKLLFLSITYLCLLGISTKQGPSLDHMIIEVNGVPKFFYPGDDLQIVMGDTLKVTKAIQKDGKHVNSINIYGYLPADAKSFQDERHKLVDSAADFNPSQSRDKKGLIYEIHGRSFGHHVGQINIFLKEPKLSYAICSINGQEKVLRDGDTLVVKKSDAFKLKEFRSNISELDHKVTYRLLPHPNHGSNYHYLFEFERSGYVFARIPVMLEEE